MARPYSDKVLDHFRQPRNRRAIAAPTVSQDGANPLCGDRIRMELRIDGDVVTDAAFTANACAICVASASVLTELVRNAPLEDIHSFTVADLLAQLQSDIPSARMACVKLPLTVLHTGLQLHALRAG